MSFLQPWMLVALPIAALPVIIHLINQRRYQTLPWAAMMFLLAANQMSRGYARLRQWLILGLRVVAIAALLFVISRPLAGGWLGAATGDRAETTLILLDRSPSMQQMGVGTAMSKLETGQRQVRDTLRMLGGGRVVLIDSGQVRPRELDSVDALVDMPEAGPADNSADIPAMLQEATDYLDANEIGRADIWLVSDLRTSDWQPESGRWAALRETLLQRPQTTRFRLLAYPEVQTENRAIAVTGVKYERAERQKRILLSLEISGGSVDEPDRIIPVQVEIEGSRIEVPVHSTGGRAVLRDYPLPLDDTVDSGWGRVSLPADANLADNVAFFAFEPPVPRVTVLFCEDDTVRLPLRLAAEIPSEPSAQHRVLQTQRGLLQTVPWEEVGLLLWQGVMPAGGDLQAVEAFLAAGGQAMFFPSRSSDTGQLQTMRFGDWQGAVADQGVSRWRGDQGLLAGTLAGGSLPVGELQIKRFTALEGAATTLARLSGDVSLLLRHHPTGDHAGTVYFWATTPHPEDSSLGTDGIVLYVAIQRALAAGAAALQSTADQVAGSRLAERWSPIVIGDQRPHSEPGYHAGVFQDGEHLLTIRRATAEDQLQVVADDQLQGLFRGLDFTRIDDRAGNYASLIHEVWRLFLILMVLAMLGEAWLCLPQARGSKAGGRS